VQNESKNAIRDFPVYSSALNKPQITRHESSQQQTIKGHKKAKKGIKLQKTQT